MYVGELHDFFYKPKDWIFQQPKFNQKIDNTYININGKIYRINELTGEMILCNTIPKTINFPKNTEKSKINNRLNSIKRNRNRNNSESYKENFLNIENSKTTSSKNTKFKDIFNQSPKSQNDTEIKNDKNNNTITLENNDLFQNKYIDKSNNKSINITPTNKNKSYYPKNKSLEPIIFSQINNLTSNTNVNANSIKFPKNKNLLKNEVGNKTVFYFNKKKYFKPTIAFGQKIMKSFSLEDKIKQNNKNKSKNKNILYFIHRQHNNNLTKEGRINDKIYDREKGDNIIFKTYRDQIFKEKIENRLKKKYQFYEDKKGKKLKVPLISHYNYDFYRGYSFSDNKRVPIHHKLFFKYVIKDKIKQIEEKMNELNYIK